MTADLHMHCEFSGDSDTPIRDMVNSAVERGLDTICFTDHQDWDYPDPEFEGEFDTDAYFSTIQALREEYRGTIKILTGVELGLQPHLGEGLDSYTRQYPFDFCIGSSHIVNGVDPVRSEYFTGRPEQEAFTEYFESVIQNIRSCKSFDVYGHIDYIVRYAPNKNRFFSYRQHAGHIDEILNLLITNNKGLEINTGGFRYGLNHPNPHEDILKRYKELNGELITIGSDAHVPQYIGYEFNTAKEILRQCGFRYFTVFENRQPQFHKL